MIDKKIYRLTNVELYDVSTNGSTQFLKEDLKIEWDSRKLSLQKIVEIESDYCQFINFQQQRNDAPLTKKEYLTLFVFPFFTPKPRWRYDHLSQSEFRHYKANGYHKKHEQALKVRQFGILFWLLFFMVAFLIYYFFNN